MTAAANLARDATVRASLERIARLATNIETESRSQSTTKQAAEIGFVTSIALRALGEAA